MEHFPSILLGKYNHHRCLGADAIITVATTVFWPLANIATIITVATAVILAVGQYSNDNYRCHRCDLGRWPI